MRKYFQICMCNFREKYGNISQFDTLLLASTLHSLQFQWNWNYLSNTFRDKTNPTLILCEMVYVGLMRSPFCTFFLTRILVKTMLYHDVVTTLETDVATTLILDLATTLWQDQTWRRCDVVTTSLSQLGLLKALSEVILVRVHTSL